MPNMDVMGASAATDVNTDELRFRDKLMSYQLPELYVNVLTLKIFYNWTLAEIAEFLHMPSGSTVHGVYKKSLKLLKERGYKK